MIKHNSHLFEIFLSTYQAYLREADFLEHYRLFLDSVSVYKHFFAHQKVVDKFQQAISFSSVQFYSEI